MISRISMNDENFRHFGGAVLDIEETSFPCPWSVNAFKEELANPLSHFFALLRDDRLIAYICFWMFAGEIHLLNIAVHPGERRKGYGRQLLGEMIGMGLENRIEAVWLEVRPSNQTARMLYEKMGFKEMGRRPRYYRETDEDAIIMCLSVKETLTRLPRVPGPPMKEIPLTKAARISCPFDN